MKPNDFSTFEAFTRHARQGNLVPVSLSMLADTFTPVSAFLRLSVQQRYGFLLESISGGEKMARYSFLGIAPAFLVRYHCAAGRPARRSLQLEPLSDRHAGFASAAAGQDIFTYLQTARQRLRPVRVPGLPRFTGGFVGFFGYETVHDLERLPAAQTTPHFPDAEFGFYDTILAFDHVRQEMLLITHVLLAEGELNLRRRYEEAVERLDELRQRLHAPLPPPAAPAAPRQRPEPQANFTAAAFCAAVARAREHIAAGDIFQVVLSQRFSCPLTVPPFQLYRALRQSNPSPYLFFLQHDQNTLLGSSPEALLRVEEGMAEMRPIAGTRRRGLDDAEDQRLEEELRADAKERAEHLMLVDLSRNDLGRVCDYASIEVPELMTVERYSHVMHLVSSVRGRLRPGVDAIDALRACFPAGTVSGAPKIRAMEIIAALEPEARGPYAGAVGYLDVHGNLDTCITIRTIWTQGRQAFFQAGAGIVADSDPGREYQETIEKSRAVWNAIDVADRGL
ncbi:MAG: anthranilate synthase component I [candidate division KSB1 bacterium]|nr:anthranilate synthase component I [candidate division KSB1 bacterium]MDZ7275931.1 anthranilate synthase component I [candidate division KSB1 bacterium]MDZ7285787.1 anthranilate synthase component I [candidate division KSB1 bacterium]MDZ7298819.1 anthranilate synthase component I [candidate division KSB1 bacterium]MDZ7309439.1 anthranilate synthase component I [candidate division KSB1 bacterium]